MKNKGDVVFLECEHTDHAYVWGIPTTSAGIRCPHCGKWLPNRWVKINGEYKWKGKK